MVAMIIFLTNFTLITKETSFPMVAMVIFFTVVTLVTKVTTSPVVAVTRSARNAELCGNFIACYG
jgi:hypothetical protein